MKKCSLTITFTNKKTRKAFVEILKNEAIISCDIMDALKEINKITIEECRDVTKEFYWILNEE